LQSDSPSAKTITLDDNNNTIITISSRNARL
jgi:hypothetical protein